MFLIFMRVLAVAIMARRWVVVREWLACQRTSRENDSKDLGVLWGRTTVS